MMMMMVKKREYDDETVDNSYCWPIPIRPLANKIWVSMSLASHSTNYSGEARKDYYDGGDGDGVGDGDSDGPIREHVVYSFMPYSYIRATCSLIGSKVCFVNQEIISL